MIPSASMRSKQRRAMSGEHAVALLPETRKRSAIASRLRVRIHRRAEKAARGRWSLESSSSSQRRSLQSGGSSDKTSVPLLAEETVGERAPAARAQLSATSMSRRVPQTRLRSSLPRMFRARSAPASGRVTWNRSSFQPSPAARVKRTAAARPASLRGSNENRASVQASSRDRARSAPTDRQLASADQHNGRSMTP